MNKVQKDFEGWAKRQRLGLVFWANTETYASNETLYAWHAYKAAHNAQQAIIDRLMLEYCPREMTLEQMQNWEASQKRVEG